MASVRCAASGRHRALFGGRLLRRRRQALGHRCVRPEPPREATDGSADQSDVDAIAVLVVALVVHHNIKKQEIIIFCVVVPRSSPQRSCTASWPSTRSVTTQRRARRAAEPQPGRARRSGRHLDRAGAALAERDRGLRVGQAGAGERRSVAQPAEQGRRGVFGGPFVNAGAGGAVRLAVHPFRAAGPAADWVSASQWSTSAQIMFFAGVVNVGLFVFNMIPVAAWAARSSSTAAAKLVAERACVTASTRCRSSWASWY